MKKNTKIYDKRDDFNFDIVNFPFLNGDVLRRPSYGVYISQLIRFARASTHVTDFNNRNRFLTAKLLKQSYRYHKLRKAFSKFYCACLVFVKDRDSTAPKRGSVLIGLMTPDGAIWYRYQRAVLMR